MLKRSLRMAGDESGLAAVEFALILPVMIVLFFGVYETSQALGARADVVNLTSAAADLVAQGNSASIDDINNVYNAASAILDPYPRLSPQQRPSIRITSIIDDGKGVKDPVTGITPPHASGKVDWVCTQKGSDIALLGTAPSKNASVNLVKPIMALGSSVIRVEVAYEYNSPTTQSITGPLPMTSTFFTKPRRAMQITGPGAC